MSRRLALVCLVVLVAVANATLRLPDMKLWGGGLFWEGGSLAIAAGACALVSWYLTSVFLTRRFRPRLLTQEPDPYPDRPWYSWPRLAAAWAGFWVVSIVVDVSMNAAGLDDRAGITLGVAASLAAGALAALTVFPPARATDREVLKEAIQC